MRAAILAVAAASLVFVPHDAQAQCVGVSCSSLPKPTIQFNFGVPAPSKKSAPLPATPRPTTRNEIVPDPIDCKMVKPVDPKFQSNMPIVRPDPNVEFPMKIVLFPPCRG